MKKRTVIGIYIAIAIPCLILIVLLVMTLNRGINQSGSNPIVNEATDSDTSFIPPNEEPGSRGEAESESESEPEQAPDQEPEPEPEPEPDYELTLVAFGDNLLHMGIVKTGLLSDGSYNFDFEFEQLGAYIKGADISVINQETPLAGNERGFSGFPYFNSPTEVAEAISDAGFDVVLGATNHAYDQGLSGLISHADYWKNNYPEILLTGIEGSEQSSAVPCIEIDGFRIAFLNYTYGPNLESFPSELEGHLNMLCAYNENTRLLDFTSLNPQVCEDIRAAKESCDLVFVFPHWGTEYALSPSSYQQKFAAEMIDAGADLIIGTHPHVVQPVEEIVTEAGNHALCFYSLGNYVSTQKNMESILEAMALVTLHVDVPNNKITVDNTKSGAIPLVLQYSSGPVRMQGIYLLDEYNEDLAAEHGIHSYGGVNLKYEDLDALAAETLGSYRLPAAALDILANTEADHHIVTEETE